MKKFLLTAALLTTTAPAWAQTHDADFPEQMRAINQCYVEIITKQREGGDKNLALCIEEKGFKFCKDCQIFRYSGGPCSEDTENGIHRATCWKAAPDVCVTAHVGPPYDKCQVYDDSKKLKSKR